MAAFGLLVTCLHWKIGYFEVSNIIITYIYNQFTDAKFKAAFRHLWGGKKKKKYWPSLLLAALSSL